MCFSPDVEMIESEKIGRGTFASIRTLGPLQNSVQIWGTSRETFAENRDLAQRSSQPASFHGLAFRGSTSPAPALGSGLRSVSSPRCSGKFDYFEFENPRF